MRNSIKLVEICSPKQWKTIGISELSNKGYPVYGANGIIGYYGEYNHEFETLLIGCRGTCGTIHISKPKSYINGNAMCLDSLSDRFYIKYLFYFFQWFDFSSIISGSSQPQITITGLGKVFVPLIPIEEQLRIAENLDKATHTIDICNAILEKLDLLVKARFVEMFGDLVDNDRQWDSFKLLEVSDIVSGITKGRKVKEVELFEVPYMAVSNVKDGYIDWTTVKTILATAAEIKQYKILPEDVLMTEGGDPDKLGRGSIIYQVPENCIHQNHIFRVRLNQEKIIPIFFSEYLKHQAAKSYFLKCAKQTTGIASINMTQLKALPVLIPPLDLQKKYAAFVAQTDKTKAAVQQVLSKAETLKKALMQEYFG